MQELQDTYIHKLAFYIIGGLVGIVGFITKLNLTRAQKDYDDKIKRLFEKTDRIDKIENDLEWVIKLTGVDVPDKKNPRE